MNIFVLSTGRCGTLAFAKACSHITNYTTGHETNIRVVGKERLTYPDNHIEIDNRLCWFLGRLDEQYGNDAFYVHLVREPRDTAMSFVNRFFEGSIMLAYSNGIYAPLIEPVTRDKFCRDYVLTVHRNIELFLKDKTKKMKFDIAKAAYDFVSFMVEIGAEGLSNCCVEEFSNRHNVTVE